MKKFLKWAAIIILGLVVVLFGVFKFMQSQTKKHSPEETVVYSQDGTEISVFYNRPYKKGREIFGGLVPYDKVWRTGANEATTFTTNKDLTIGGKTLPAGKYTLWTIPGKDQWSVIFNKKQYGWGVDFNQQALREPEEDALLIDVPAEKLGSPVEQFTIAFDSSSGDPAMILTWDTAKVAVPFK